MDSSPPVSSLFHFPGKNTGVGCPAPRDPPDPGIEPVSLSYPALETEFFTTLPPGKPLLTTYKIYKIGKIQAISYGDIVHRGVINKHVGSGWHLANTQKHYYLHIKMSERS